MRWDRLFDDLEAQASAEWEAERAALASESERVRLSRVSLRDRLLVLREAQAQVRAHLSGGGDVEGWIVAVGADWFALDRGPSSVSIVPLAGLMGLRMPHADLLHSASGRAGQALRERVDLGFVLRDLARRRVPVLVELVAGDSLTGTVDRAGADHFDLALHDLDTPRHPSAVTGFRMVPFGALAQLIVAAGDSGL